MCGVFPGEASVDECAMIPHHLLAPRARCLFDESPNFLIIVRTAIVDRDGHQCRRHRSAGSILGHDLPQHQRASAERRARSPMASRADTRSESLEPGERSVIAGFHERARPGDSAGFGPALVFE
jgi:hypothetical protein